MILTCPDHLGVELEILVLLLRGLRTALPGADDTASLSAITGTLLREHLLSFTGVFVKLLDPSQPPPYFREANGVLWTALSIAERKLNSS